MVNIENYRRIYELISKYLSYGLDSGEKQELQKWLDESEENQKLYAKITDPDYLIGQEKKRNSIDIEKYWERFERKTGKYTKRNFLRNYWKYVAVLLLLLGSSLIIWLIRQETPEVLVKAEQIHPGISKACLLLANGETVELGKENKTKLQIKRDGAIICNDSGGLKYNTEKIEQSAVARHILIIPKGGEYIMTMEDGTVVYLNSESKIEYPVRFTEKNREVYLEGEAYFKVAHKEEQPFIVKTKNMDIKVLGTEFNVKAYTDEKWVQTTLVQGKVSVFTGINRTTQNLLKPEQQAELSLENGKLQIKEVDTAPFIAWKNGQFLFKGERLEKIMTVLERWYDFEVFYQGEWIKDIEFAGKLNRSDSIEPILDVIRSTHKLNVEIKGKTIVFSAI